MSGKVIRLHTADGLALLVNRLIIQRVSGRNIIAWQVSPDDQFTILRDKDVDDELYKAASDFAQQSNHLSRFAENPSFNFDVLLADTQSC